MDTAPIGDLGTSSIRFSVPEFLFCAANRRARTSSDFSVLSFVGEASIDGRSLSTGLPHIIAIGPPNLSEIWIDIFFSHLSGLRGIFSNVFCRIRHRFTNMNAFSGRSVYLIPLSPPKNAHRTVSGRRSASKTLLGITNLRHRIIWCRTSRIRSRMPRLSAPTRSDNCGTTKIFPHLLPAPSWTLLCPTSVAWPRCVSRSGPGRRPSSAEISSVRVSEFRDPRRPRLLRPARRRIRRRRHRPRVSRSTKESANAEVGNRPQLIA